MVTNRQDIWFLFYRNIKFSGHTVAVTLFCIAQPRYLAKELANNKAIYFTYINYLYLEYIQLMDKSDSNLILTSILGEMNSYIIKLCLLGWKVNGAGLTILISGTCITFASRNFGKCKWICFFKLLYMTMVNCFIFGGYHSQLYVIYEDWIVRLQWSTISRSWQRLGCAFSSMTKIY